MVSGNHWTGAHSWTSTDNARIKGTITDPMNKFVFEMHQFMDPGYSGVTDECVTSTIGSSVRFYQSSLN